MKPKLKARNNAAVAPRAGWTIPDSGDLPTASAEYANQFRVSGGMPYFCDGTAWRCLVAGLAQSATIASGAVALAGPWVRLLIVDTQGGAATDDLDTISGGTVGQVVTVRTAANARDVTARDGIDNLMLAGNMTLDNNDDTLTVVWTGNGWREVARSNNT